MALAFWIDVLENILCDQVYKELKNISEMSLPFSRGGEEVRESSQ